VSHRYLPDTTSETEGKLDKLKVGTWGGGLENELTKLVLECSCLPTNLSSSLLSNKHVS